MSFDEQFQVFINSIIDIIINVLQENFGAIFDLVDAILMLTS